MTDVGLRWGWVELDVAALRGQLLTATEAARRAGVARRTWQRWEQYGRIPMDALERFRRWKKESP